MLQNMVERLKDNTGVDSYDMMALEPWVAAAPLTGNPTRVFCCIIIQIVIPPLVGFDLLTTIVRPEPDGPLDWARLCQYNSGWDRPLQKLLNKCWLP